MLRDREPDKGAPPGAGAPGGGGSSTGEGGRSTVQPSALRRSHVQADRGPGGERFLREIMRKNFDPRQYHRESRRRHKLPPIEGPYMSGGKG